VASRRAWLAARLEQEWEETADRFREKLVALYGAERGRKIVHAEAFEVSEYGSPVRGDAVKRLFPFF